jgi:hypothetical protein
VKPGLSLRGPDSIFTLSLPLSTHSSFLDFFNCGSAGQSHEKDGITSYCNINPKFNPAVLAITSS